MVGTGARGSAKLTRKKALSGVPVRLPVVSQEEADGGGVRLKIKLSRPGWQRWLGMSETMERTFELDSVGRRVYESCDGRRNVRSIISRFGHAHRLGRVEAEISVTKFLKMLVGKGLVAMQVPDR